MQLKTVGMLENIRADFNRYSSYSESKNWIYLIKSSFYLIFTQAIWAIIVYRFGSWSNKLKMPFFPLFLKIIYFFLNKFIEITTGISISSNADIGKGFYIGHFGGIFVHPETKIGKNCSIGQGVTIGTLGLGKKGVPEIGNNVYIGVSAKVLGSIRIGDNVRIGANAVVIENIPDNATAVGIPAKVVKIKSTIR